MRLGTAPLRSMTNEVNSGLSSIQGEEETEVRVSQSTFMISVSLFGFLLPVPLFI